MSCWGNCNLSALLTAQNRDPNLDDSLQNDWIHTLGRKDGYVSNLYIVYKVSHIRCPMFSFLDEASWKRNPTCLHVATYMTYMRKPKSGIRLLVSGSYNRYLIWSILNNVLHWVFYDVRYPLSSTLVFVFYMSDLLCGILLNCPIWGILRETSYMRRCMWDILFMASFLRCPIIISCEVSDMRTTRWIFKCRRNASHPVNAGAEPLTGSSFQTSHFGIVT